MVVGVDGLLGLKSITAVDLDAAFALLEPAADAEAEPTDTAKE